MRPDIAGLDQLTIVGHKPTRLQNVTQRWLDLTLGALVASLTLWIHLSQVGRISLWYDEAFSVGLARQPWGVFLQFVWGGEANMTLYYAVLRLWFWLTGHVGLRPTEFIVHIPSAVLAACSAVVVFLLGRRFSGPLTGGLAAVLYAINYLQLYEAGQARAYSMQLFLICVSWYALLAALQSGPSSRRWWIVYVLATVLAVYAHLFSVLVFASQIVALAIVASVFPGWAVRVQDHWRSLVAGLVGVCLLIAPIGCDVLLHGAPNVWVVPNARGLRSLVGFISGPDKIYGIAVLAAAALAVLITRGEKRGLAMVFACWAASPVVVSYALTQPGLNLHLFLSRYLVVIVPAICLMAAMAVDAVADLRLRLGAAAVLVLLSVPSVPGYFATEQRADVRTAAVWVSDRYQTKDGMVCLSGAECSIPMDYYLSANSRVGGFPAAAPGAWSWATRKATPTDLDAVVLYARTHRRVFVISSSPPYPHEVGPITAWLHAHASALSRVSSGGIEVTLYAVSESS